MIRNTTNLSLPMVPGSGGDDRHAFIIGQGMDGIRTGYTAAHTFFGSIAEVNLWDYPLNEEDIKDIAGLNVFPKGNVVSWKMEDFRVTGLKTANVTDMSNYLRNKKQLLIFPKRLLKKVAERTCSAYGGSIVTPESNAENAEVMTVLLQQRKVCLDEFTVTKDPEMGIWLGLGILNKKWHLATEDSGLIPMNYSNWNDKKSGVEYSPLCAIMNNDGSWAAQTDSQKCDSNQLCTICSFTKPPIFGLRGICETGSFQWFYYPILNATNQIDRYEGYLSAQEISYQKGKWKSDKGADGIRVPKIKEIVGRNEWDWYEESCSKKESKRNLTFTNCDVDNQFTCDYGDCISIKQTM